LGEGAAEVVRAATDGGGEAFEFVILVEVLDEMGFDSLDPFMGGAFGAFGAGDEIDGLGGGTAVSGEELAEKEIGEAGFVEQEAGGVTQVRGHEAASPAEVLLVKGAAEAKNSGLGLCYQKPRGFWKLGEEGMEVLGEPRIRKNQGQALVTVAGGGAEGGFGIAAPSQSLGRQGEGGGACFEGEEGNTVKVEMEAEGFGLEGLRPRGSLWPAALAGVPEASGLRDG
jgi:hypothetical protein